MEKTKRPKNVKKKLFPKAALLVFALLPGGQLGQLLNFYYLLLSKL